MEKINKTADRFRKVRADLGITQQQMADRLMLSRNFIAKIESGLAEPSARTLSSLESLLNYSTRPPAQAAGEMTIALNEDQAPYGARTAAKVPTEDQLLAYFKTSIQAAREVPGGYGYVWGIMKMHLNPEQIKRLSD